MDEINRSGAAMWMVAAMLILGVIDSFVAVMAETISVWQLYVVRMIIAVPIVVGVAAASGVRAYPRKWGAVLLRSFAIASAMLFYFASLGFLPIAQSLAGLFTSPIIVVVITALFLNEKIGPYRIGAVLVGFVGTMLVLQINPMALRPEVFVPVIGGVFYAAGAIITRRWCWGETTHALLAAMIFAQGVLGLLGLAGLALFGIEEQAGNLAFVTRGWVWPMGEAGPILLMHILGSIAGVFALTRAYQLGEASYVAVFEYTIMIFGPVFAFYWFGQVLGLGQVAGIGLIIAAGAVIALRSEAA